jgi:hypothetical protein
MMFHFIKETAKESYFTGLAMKNDVRKEDGYRTKL